MRLLGPIFLDLVPSEVSDLVDLKFLFAALAEAVAAYEVTRK